MTCSSIIRSDFIWAKILVKQILAIMTSNQIHDIATLSAKRYLAFFDLLGFSELVKREDTSEVARIIHAIQHFANIARGYGEEPFFSQRNNEENHQNYVQSLFVSDSVVFVTNGATIEDFANVIITAQGLLSMCMLSSIPIRGAITTGDLIFDLGFHILYGKPMVEAVELEKIQEWFGVAIHPSCSSNINPEHISGYIEKGYIKKYSPPLKSNTSAPPEYVLDWLNQHRSNLKERGFDRVLTRMFSNLIIKSSDSTRPSVQQKCLNTLRFLYDGSNIDPTQINEKLDSFINNAFNKA